MTFALLPLRHIYLPFQLFMILIFFEVSSATTTFWQSLPNLSIDQGKFFKLPSNVYIHADPALGQELLVRECYGRMWDILRREQDNDQQQKVPLNVQFLVWGNPGIGKSLFLVYLAHSLFHHRLAQTVVYQSNESQVFVISSKGLPDASSSLAVYSVAPQYCVETVLRQDATWYLVDSVSPVKSVAPTVVVASPGIQKKVRSFSWVSKWENIREVYFPVWSDTEIKEALSLSRYEGLDKNVVWEAFRCWGGNARQVLQLRKAEKAQENVNDMIQKVDTDLLTGKAEGKDPKASFALLHYMVDPQTLQKTGLDFASRYVGCALLRAWEAKAKASIVTFLKSSQGEGEMSALRGYALENYAINKLSTGGSFAVRPLEDTSTVEDKVDIYPKDAWYFPSVENLTDLELNRFAIPVKRNQGAIDSLFMFPIENKSVIWLFQMTVAKRHPVKSHCLMEVLKRTARFNAREVRLFWVVPEGDEFKNFSKQSFVALDGHVIADVNLTKDVREVHQWVLAMPLRAE